MNEGGYTDAQRAARRAYFYDLARRDGDREMRAYQSGSRTDAAEAPMFGLRRKAWLAIEAGEDAEATLTGMDAAWRAYAETNNAKVKAAPAIKRGPRSGQSCIGHRWVNPDFAAASFPFMRTMIERAPA